MKLIDNFNSIEVIFVIAREPTFEPKKSAKMYLNETKSFYILFTINKINIFTLLRRLMKLALKLCLATAIHNPKWLKIIHISICLI